MLHALDWPGHWIWTQESFCQWYDLGKRQEEKGVDITAAAEDTTVATVCIEMETYKAPMNYLIILQGEIRSSSSSLQVEDSLILTLKTENSTLLEFH